METTPTVTSPSPSVPARSRRESFWVGAFITATALVVVLIMAMICYRWMKVVEPTTLILVIGTPAHDGAKLEVVDQVGEAKPIDVTLGRSNDFRSTVMLYPGRYSLTATDRDGRQLLKTEFTVLAYRGLEFELPPPESAPAIAATQHSL